MSLPQREGRRPNQPPQKPSHPGQRARLALYTDVLSGLSQPLVDLTLFLDSDYDDVGKTGESRAHVQKISIPSVICREAAKSMPVKCCECNVKKKRLK